MKNLFLILVSFFINQYY